MADIELVIKIPEEKYNEYKRIGDSRDILFEAIRNGSILPKGHGDLIDRNKLRKHERSVKDGNATWLMDVYLPEEIDNALPIIESDKESDG